MAIGDRFRLQLPYRKAETPEQVQGNNEMIERRFNELPVNPACVFLDNPNPLSTYLSTVPTNTVYDLSLYDETRIVEMIGFEYRTVGYPRLYAQVPGWYLINVVGRFDFNGSSGTRAITGNIGHALSMPTKYQVGQQKTVRTYYDGAFTYGTYPQIHLSWVAPMIPGAEVTVTARQDSGADEDWGLNEVSIHWLRPLDYLR